MAITATHAPAEPIDFCQHNDVDGCDGEQEEHRDQRAHHAANLDQSREALLEVARRQGNHYGCDKHHHGMAKGEVKTDRDRPLAFLPQFAGNVVDCRYVIGIHRRPKPYAMRQVASSSGSLRNKTKAQSQANRFATPRTAWRPITFGRTRSSRSWNTARIGDSDPKGSLDLTRR